MAVFVNGLLLLQPRFCAWPNSSAWQTLPLKGFTPLPQTLTGSRRKFGPADTRRPERLKPDRVPTDAAARAGSARSHDGRDQNGDERAAEPLCAVGVWAAAKEPEHARTDATQAMWRIVRC